MWRLMCVGVIFISSICLSVFGDRIEIPAYEYIKRFKGQLNLGQCPNRIVSLPDPTREYCTYPRRPGVPRDKLKNVDFKFNRIIQNASELFNSIGLCDEKSVAYFGLLNDGDCVASEIAGKLSFKKKHVTRLYLEHYRPRMLSLMPSSDLGVPEEYTNHLNNTYYTENIGIGTEEAIIVEMQFRKAVHSQKAATHKLDIQAMSQILEYTARHIGVPRKIKVIRYSTAEELLSTEVFKGTDGFENALKYIKHCERRIHDIRRGLNRGIIQSHLKYGFKAYEFQPKFPYSLPLSMPSSLGPSEAQRHKIWEDVTLLQVDARRTYVTYKRYRKRCRSTTIKDPKHKYCLLVKQSLRALKMLITKIHTRRRDWVQTDYNLQQRFVSEGRVRVKLLKTRLKLLAKSLKPFLKRSGKPSKG